MLELAGDECVMRPQDTAQKQEPTPTPAAPPQPPVVPPATAPPPQPTPPPPTVQPDAQPQQRDVEAGVVVSKSQRKRKTTQNDSSHGSFFLRVGAIGE